MDFKTQKDEDGLVAKLKESSLKLDVMKTDDANQKIGDYKTKLNQLNSQSKILEATGIFRADATVPTACCIASPTSASRFSWQA